eukprot:c20105_g1_i1.p1 GENE.c20105_g1_i1~~c20105_g1_i1.p1  ORF type:complete len:318 (+),score=69.15 c20105_g1_i1:461-1414(+)
MFGRRAGISTLVCLLALTYLSCVAHCVAIRDTLAPILEHPNTIGIEPSNQTTQMLMVIAVIVIMPLAFLPSLFDLRWTSAVGVFFAFVSAISLMIHASNNNDAPQGVPNEKILLFPDSALDAVAAFPIFVVAYLSHFNLLPLYRDLVVPSHRRVSRMRTETVVLSGVLYILISVAAFLSPYDSDNIFANSRTSDHALTLSRATVAASVAASLPLAVVACRQYLREFVSLANFPESTSQRLNRHPNLLGIFWTLVIVAAALGLAAKIDSVMEIWNTVARTLGLLISIVLPLALYLKIDGAALWSRLQWCISNLVELRL